MDKLDKDPKSIIAHHDQDSHKKKRIKWDEEAIAEYEKNKGTYTKITEPKTPYHYYDVDLDENVLEDSSANVGENKSDLPIITSKPHVETTQKSQVVNLSKLDPDVLEKKVLEKIDKMNREPDEKENEDEEDDEEKRKKHEEFAAKRKAHYKEGFDLKKALAKKRSTDNDDI